MKPREDPFAAWTCSCDAPSACEHAAHGLVLAPGCAAYATLASEGRDRGAEIELRGGGATPEVDVVARRRDGLAVPAALETSKRDATWRVQAPAFTARGVESIRVVVRNASREPIWVERVSARDDLPPPSRAVGALLFAEHHSELTIEPGHAIAQLWAPLPALHASQVPLHVEVDTEPPDVAYSFVAHDDTNWGVVFEFPPSRRAQQVVLEWRAVVLTRHVWPDERPRVYAARSDPSRWLVPTEVADTNADVVRDVARTIAAADDPPLTKLERLLAFTTTELAPGGNARPTAETDATATAAATLRGRKRDPISCTGFATSTTALGRALGLPTRYLAGYEVGEQMQTHAINEVYLGRELGWRRVEPQLDALAIPEDYLVVVRVVGPADEGPQAMAPHRIAVPGSPVHAVIENLAAPERLTYRDETPYFEGCPRCNNRASRLGVFEDVDGARIEAAFATASASFVALRHALVAGGDAEALFEDRREMEAVRDLAGLEAVLGR